MTNFYFMELGLRLQPLSLGNKKGKINKMLDSILQAVKNFHHTIYNVRDYNVTVNELSQLSDRELKDIGINSKGDIYRVAAEHIFLNDKKAT